MQFTKAFKNALMVVYLVIRYNLKTIFANKFIYFLFAALMIFIILSGIYVMSANALLTESSVFWLILIPGILIVFYPVTYGIQNISDSRMLEIVFGIPNYRYKVMLVRLLLIFAVSFLILAVISIFSSFALTTFSVSRMLYHIMFPVIFFGCAAFMAASCIRDGTATAVVILVVGIILWIGRDFFTSYPQWDLFLNPFNIPQNMREYVWAEKIRDNRLYMSIGSIAAVFLGLLSLQKREKFL